MTAISKFDGFGFLKGYIHVNEEGKAFYHQKGAELLIRSMSLSWLKLYNQLKQPNSTLRCIFTSKLEDYNYTDEQLDIIVSAGLYPDYFISDLISYEAIYEQEKIAIKLMRRFTDYFLRQLGQKVTNWEPQTNQEVLQLMASMVSETALPWEKRFDDIFFEALEQLYGISRYNRCVGNIIAAYVYRWFPDVVTKKLNEVNPLIPGERFREKPLHTFFTGELLHLLESHIKNVTVMMMRANTVYEFRKSMRSIPKFGQGNRLLKGR